MEKAVRLMYERLAVFLVESLDFEKVSSVLEVGCRRGQLTLPFVRNVAKVKPDVRVVALDLSARPYRGHLDSLKVRVRREGLERFIAPVNADVRHMGVIRDESGDLVVSNETLCELDRSGLEMAIREFSRVLKHDRMMVHGELMPAFENDAQRLLLEANQHSLETSIPKPAWVSPFSDEVAAFMHRVGFKDITVRYFETNVKMDFNTALKKLKQWHVKPIWIKEHLQEIKRYGLEYPMEHLIFSRK